MQAFTYIFIAGVREEYIQRDGCGGGERGKDMPLLPLEAYRGNGKASGGNSAKELGNVNNHLCLYLAIIGPQRALL